MQELNMKTALVALAAVLVVGTQGTLAQQSDVKSSDSIREALMPGHGKTRGLTRGFAPPAHSPECAPRNTRGIAIIGPDAPPEVDLKVNFDFGSYQLTDQARRQLTELARAVTSNELIGYSFELAGHTDAVGTDDSNLILSRNRADAVRRYLASEFGIDGSRLTARGFGEACLLKPEDPYAADNRRVQVTNIGK